MRKGATEKDPVIVIKAIGDQSIDKGFSNGDSEERADLDNITDEGATGFSKSLMQRREPQMIQAHEPMRLES